MEPNRPRDVAQLRLDNALRLFDEFVAATVKHPDAATLRGLERRFAERLQIQPSYWSQIKSRSRQIGERLARQFEQQCHKPWGWMDQPHDTTAPVPLPGAPTAEPPAVPRDDDERFIVGLVLTYYRRHPAKARQRLLDLLGEVLTPPAEPAPPAPQPAAPIKPTSLAPGVVRPGPAPAPAPVDDHSLWAGSQTGVAPLAPRKRR